MARVAFVLVLLVVCPVLAQESPSYKMTEHVFNAGGHPSDGMVPASASFRMTLEAVGDPVTRSGLEGPFLRMDAGFATCYPPPGEIRGLWFADRDHLHWNPDRSAGDYNLYRGLVGNLEGGGYGDCEQPGLSSASAADGGSPPAAAAWFYLVTARNRLREEGTKGRDSNGLERANSAPCP